MPARDGPWLRVPGVGGWGGGPCAIPPHCHREGSGERRRSTGRMVCVSPTPCPASPRLNSPAYGARSLLLGPVPLSTPTPHPAQDLDLLQTLLTPDLLGSRTCSLLAARPGPQLGHLPGSLSCPRCNDFPVHVPARPRAQAWHLSAWLLCLWLPARGVLGTQECVCQGGIPSSRLGCAATRDPRG